MMKLVVSALLAILMFLPSYSLAANLNVNSEHKNVRVVVYEVPDDEGRADVVRYVESIRDRFYGGLEAIDAAKLDDAALKTKLKEGFVLYTTIGEKSRLFKAATQPLNIQIDGGTLRWKEINLPLSDLRIILVGKNPYGEGHCNIYAAGSNKMLININSMFHGPCSYHIFQGEKLLKEGFYNEKFVDFGFRITQAEAVEDTRNFFSTLQRVHPDLLAKVDIKEYIKLKQQTLDGIAAKLGKDDKISVEDLAYLLYYAAAYFQDGHTSVHWQFQPNESNTQGKRFPPFRLECENGQFLITSTDNKSIEGLEIISVDGKPIKEFLSPILDRCSGETLAFKASRFTGKQTFWYSFSNLFGSAPSIALKLRDAKGKESGQKVETVSLAEFQKLESGRRDNKLSQLRRQGTHVNFLDSDKVAHFVYPSFKLNDEEKQKVDDIFNEIKAKKSQDLIIDIRGNGGGNSSMADHIFSYLYGDKFCSFSRGRIKLSRDILEAYGENYQVPDDADIEGVITTWHAQEQSVPKPQAFFSGRIFLLIDNGTFSSASCFATMIRDYEVGKIIGYETGGVPVSFGDQYSFNLKNSGIPYGVSWKQFFCPKPKSGDDEHGVIPDIPMSSELLKAYQGEDDPVLAFTLDHIKKNRGKSGS